MKPFEFCVPGLSELALFGAQTLRCPQAANLFKSIVKLAAAPEVQDDRHGRLIAIWNRSKHFDEDITNPRRPEWGDAEIIAPVWLINEGVSCADASITFEELHSFLIDLQNLFKSFAELPTP